MRVVIAGVQGRVARRLAKLLCARGDAVIGIVRTPEAEAEVAAGSTPIPEALAGLRGPVPAVSGGAG